MCHKHRLWLGEPVKTLVEQHDLKFQPEALAAARRHSMVVSIYGENAAHAAYRDAGDIVWRWRQSGLLSAAQELRLARYSEHGTPRVHINGVEVHVVLYPDVVALTEVLADPRWRAYAASAPAETASGGVYVHQRKRLFYEEVSRKLGRDCGPRSYSDPLASWVRDQELTTTGAHRRNSALSPEQRMILCQRIDAGRAIKHVAAEAGISRHAMTKWHARWRQHGEAGLLDRTSTPTFWPHATAPATVQLIEAMRREQRIGVLRISRQLREVHGITVGQASVHRILTRLGMNKRLAPPEA